MHKHNIMAHRVRIGDIHISQFIIMTAVKCDLRYIVFYVIYTNSY